MTVQWYPGHMAQALREMKNKLRLVDLIIEVCDARIPKSSRNPELITLIQKKPYILVLNKADLADPAVTRQWLNAFQKRSVIAISCNSNRQQGVGQLQKAAGECCRDVVSRERERGRTFRPIRAMVVGIPNTGKSTLINALSGRKSARTSNEPGVTRQLGWIRAGQLELLDSPGVLWPKIENQTQQLYLAATGAIRDDLLPISQIAMDTFMILIRQYPERMRQRYQIEPADAENVEPEILFEQAALRRGCLLSGNRPDITRFAGLFLDDFRSGRIGRISLERPSFDGSDHDQSK